MLLLRVHSASPILKKSFPWHGVSLRGQENRTSVMEAGKCAVRLTYVTELVAFLAVVTKAPDKNNLRTGSFWLTV